MSDLEHVLRDTLAELIRRWGLPDCAPEAGAGRSAGSKTPLPSSWWSREGIAQDVKFWTRLAVIDAAIPEPSFAIVSSNVTGNARHLIANVDRLAVWRKTPGMLTELSDDLGHLRALTTEGTPGVTLEHGCGELVRVSDIDEDDASCPHCGNPIGFHNAARTVPPVTAGELVKLLERIGVRASKAGIRQMSSRGTIPAPVDTDDKGRALYAVAPTLAVFLKRQTAS